MSDPGTASLFLHAARREREAALEVAERALAVTFAAETLAELRRQAEARGLAGPAALVEHLVLGIADGDLWDEVLARIDDGEDAA